MPAVILFVAAIAISACGGSSEYPVDSESSETSASADAATFNDDDTMFAQMMIPHHEQAVELSDIALDPTVGASSEILALAQQIKGAQEPEIDQMKDLLESWQQPLMADDSMDHSSMMGGMLTIEDLDELGSLTGSDFDAAWIEAMIAHHEGAIDMAENVLENGVSAEIRALAEDIIAGQSAEIETLGALLG